MNRYFQRLVGAVMLSSSIIVVADSRGVDLSIQGIIGVALGTSGLAYLLLPDEEGQ